MKFLYTDSDLCTGCRSCSATCSVARDRVFDINRARIRVAKDEERCLYSITVCEQCTHPPCLPSCPVSAISRDSNTGLVSIDPVTCIGCKACITACPFGAIVMHDAIAVKCDLCNGDPQCAKACIPKAISYVDDIEVNSVKRWNAIEKRAQALQVIYGKG